MQKYFISFFCISQIAFAQQTKITTFRESGLDCWWNPVNDNLVCYSAKGADKYYDIHLARPDGTHDTCLTCNHPSLPNRHIANASWHPTGKWIIFVAEKKEHPGSSTDALPGFGAYDDIWIISMDGKKCYKLVDIPNDYDHGVICPRFSNNGKKIIWTDRVQKPNFVSAQRAFGFWNFKMADFTFGKDSIPEIKNIKTIQPGKTSFYECYGFSPDDSKIIYCSSANEKSVWTQQIFTCDTTGNNIKQLTEGNFYNEHGTFTPDGKEIVWMSNKNNKNKGTDWWMMNADGSNKRRISFMNDKKNSQYASKAVWAGLVSFNHDGTKFISGMQLSLITQEGKIVIVELDR